MSWIFNPFTGTLDQASPGSTTTPGGADTQLQFNDGGSFAGNAALAFNKTTGVLTLTGAPLALTGNISAASWGLNGLKIKGGTSTLTDTSAAGTVATGATNVFGGNTIAATNARTITDYYSAYINAPVAGTNVTLTNKWALGLAGNLKLIGGTVTASAPVLDLSQTWNAAGVVFNGLKFNVTDTASANTSTFFDFQVAGASKFTVYKSGQVLFAGQVNATNIIAAAAVYAQNDGGFVSIGANSAVNLHRDAAYILGQRNSTNAQTFRLYNTYTDTSNYERAGLNWSGNVLTLATEAAGTGTLRDLQLKAGNATVTQKIDGTLYLEVAGQAAGNARGAGAFDWQATRTNVAAVASGTSSFAFGRNAEASANYSVSIGNTNISRGLASVALGQYNQATGAYSFSTGQYNAASGSNACALGLFTAAANYGQISYGIGPGTGLVSGLAQGNLQTFYTATTAESSTQLNISGTATDRMVIPATRSVAFIGIVQAMCNVSSSSNFIKAWRIEGVITRDGSNNTRIVGTPTISVIAQDTDGTPTPSTWAVASITADDTNEALAINVTGQANTTIRWQASLFCSQIGF